MRTSFFTNTTRLSVIRFFLFIFLLLVVFNAQQALCAASPTAGDKTAEAKAQSIQPLPKMPDNIQISRDTIDAEREMVAVAQRGLDRSVSLLNFSLTALGVIAAFIGVVVAIAVAIGAYLLNKAKKMVDETATNLKAANDSKAEIERKKTKVADDFEKIQEAARTTKQLADEHIAKIQKASEYAKENNAEVRKLLEEARPLLDNIKRMESEVNETAKEIKQKNLSLDTPLSSEDKKQLDDYIKKVDLLETLVGRKLTPDDYMNRAREAYLDNKFEDALKACEEAIRLKPDYADAWYNKGVVLSKLERFEDALKALEEAIRLKPDYASAWYNKACVYAKMNKKEDAFLNLKKPIDMDKKNKAMAKTDDDFKAFWDDAAFCKIVE